MKWHSLWMDDRFMMWFSEFDMWVNKPESVRQYCASFIEIGTIPNLVLSIPMPLFPGLSQDLMHCLLGSFVSDRLQLLYLLFRWCLSSCINSSCHSPLISLNSNPHKPLSFPAYLSLLLSPSSPPSQHFFSSTVRSPEAAVGRRLFVSGANLSDLSLSNRNLDWT